MSRQSFTQSVVAEIETAKLAIYYQNYLDVRDRVLSMLDEKFEQHTIPSNYWEEELAGFDYMFDASPWIIRKLREHCYHLTGLKAYEYRRHHAHKKEPFQRKLEALRRLDPKGLFVPESRELGGFGHEIDGELVNLDTLKFYESLIALEMAGALENMRKFSGRSLVVEIGGGWGGFAYQFKKNFPECTYVIIDLPQTLLFSGVYLKTLFPNSRVLMYGGKEGRSFASEDFKEFDFILLPHYFINKQQFSAIDLAINMVSFQEMTSDQVLNYVRWLWTTGCRSVYSHNRSRSVHNNQLSDVGSILERGFRMSEISVLPVPYTVLETSGPVHWSSEPRKMAKQVIQSILAPARNVEISPLNYQHLFGYLHRQFKEHN